MRPLALAAFVLLSACGDDAASTGAPRTTAEPEEEPEVAPLDPDPPFDFRRAVLWPERHQGERRTCVVASVADAPEADPNDPEDPAAVMVRNVRCVVGHHVYEVRVLIAEAERELELDPPESHRRARRLRLRVEGLDAVGRRPIAFLEASDLVERDPGPVRPRSLPRPAFDFARTAREPELLGTRQACAIRAASYVDRPPVDERPAPDVVVVIPATCMHRNGGESAELLFTEESLEHALLVAPGATAHGTVVAPNRLRVSHVTPAPQ
jgi:hypothetical protein